MSKTISEIYDEYNTKPDIRNHMLRVAAVAFLVCDNLEEDINKEEIIAVCLLHDMGNLLKDEFKHYPEFLEPEGLEYWREQKNKLKEKYRDDENQATFKIGQEIEMKDSTFNLLREFVLIKLEEYQGIRSFELKICKYADARVGPLGVLSIKDRLREWYVRNPTKNAEYITMGNLFTGVEKEIFTKCKIKPEDITEETIKSIVSSLKDFVVK